MNWPPLNSLTLPMMEEITRAWEERKAWEEVKRWIIDHPGQALSGGVDSKDHTPDKVNPMIEPFHGMVREVGRVPAWRPGLRAARAV